MQILEYLNAIKNIGMLQILVLWPNSDAGSEDVARGLKKWRESGENLKMRFIKNLSMEYYTLLMDKTSCLIGNSSSGIREGSFIDTPTVDIGSRQQHREKSENVITVENSENQIYSAFCKQIKNGKYKRSHLYGDGFASKKIVEALKNKSVVTQKKFIY